jgi:hypothetical protein
MVLAHLHHACDVWTPPTPAVSGDWLAPLSAGHLRRWWPLEPTPSSAYLGSHFDRGWIPERWAKCLQRYQLVSTPERYLVSPIHDDGSLEDRDAKLNVASLGVLEQCLTPRYARVVACPYLGRGSASPLHMEHTEGAYMPRQSPAVRRGPGVETFGLGPRHGLIFIQRRISAKRIGG